MVSTACTMLSMYGAPISSTEAATRSHAPSVYVTPQNTAASDIISIDWSPVKQHLIHIGLCITGIREEKVVVMRASTTKWF